MKKTITKVLFSLSLILAATSCGDLLENELPSNQIESEQAIKNAEDLQKLLNASYDVMANAFNGNAQRFSELLTDNVTIIGNSGFLVQVYNRSSDFFNSDVGGFYGQPYTAIVRANSVLENLDKIELSDAEKDRFEGEAKFIRGVCHFELVRLFGQPYGYTPDNDHLGIVVKTDSKIIPLQRSTVAEVYVQVLSDLSDAATLLPPSNGVYATSYSAEGYLAKVKFQMNNFADAATHADAVIESGVFDFSTDIHNRYTEELSSEAVFATVSTELSESSIDNRSSNFRDLYRSTNENAPTLRVSEEYYQFLNGSGLDERAAWIETKDYASATDVRVFTKFDGDFMNVNLVSLTELMLISAESHAELGTELGLAEDLINQIKSRAGVPELDGANAETLVMESRIERRKEFAGEGHRLHELKRLGVLGESIIVRGAPWDCSGMVLQFPASEQSIVGYVMNPQGGCN
jgi:starch-binding outer membrane protein, SusD/RagB family